MINYFIVTFIDECKFLGNTTCFLFLFSLSKNQKENLKINSQSKLYLDM